MSMMICLQCDRLVDTDYDLDGVWDDLGYICTRCAEELNAWNEQPQEREHEQE